MDWKTILEDAIDRYTAVNGKKPHCAIVSRKTHNNVFGLVSGLAILGDTRVFYSFVPDNEIFLLSEGDFNSYPRCLSYPFAPLES